MKDLKISFFDMSNGDNPSTRSSIVALELSNFIAVRGDRQMVPKLADFGSSCALSDSESICRQCSFLQAESVCTTYAVAAPEVTLLRFFTRPLVAVSCQAFVFKDHAGRGSCSFCACHRQRFFGIEHISLAATSSPSASRAISWSIGHIHMVSPRNQVHLWREGNLS